MGREIILQIDNSESKITGLITTEFKKLKKILSYEIDARQAYFSRNFNTTRYLIDKDGVFATGLVYLVKRFLENNKLKYQTSDLRMAPKRAKQPLESIFDDLPIQPYPEQRQAALKASSSVRGIITAPTGTGKSIMIALTIKAIGLRTLVIVPNLELKKQLTQTLIGTFGFIENVTIKNIDDPSLYLDRDYDCLIIEEAHHVAASTYRDLNRKVWNGIYYRLFFTATPFRSKSEERLLFESIAGEVIYKLDYFTSVQKGYIVPVESSYIDIPPTACQDLTWQAVYRKLVVENGQRNDIIVDVVTRLMISPDRIPSVLVLVKEIAHGKALERLSGHPFVSGEADSDRSLIDKFNSGAIKCLIGTVGIIGEGIDTKPAEYVIIAGLGRSKTQFMQNIGRSVRTYPGKTSAKVIIFRDTSHKFTINHFREQTKILHEEYGVIAKKLVV